MIEDWAPKQALAEEPKSNKKKTRIMNFSGDSDKEQDSEERKREKDEKDKLLDQTDIMDKGQEKLMNKMEQDMLKSEIEAMVGNLVVEAKNSKDKKKVKK